jgi:hypothetical protein
LVAIAVDTETKPETISVVDDVPPPPKPIKTKPKDKPADKIKNTDANVIKPLPETLRAKVAPAHTHGDRGT